MTIPTFEPFDFNDGFVLFTEEQLEAMTYDQLAAYGSTVSTSVGLEQSTIYSNEMLQGQYDLLARLEQITMDGLDYEISLNEGAIAANDSRINYLYEQSTISASTIHIIKFNIQSQQDIFDEADSTIRGLNAESAKLDSTIALEDAAFVSSATKYSTLYYTYMGWEDLLKQKVEFIYGNENYGEQMLEISERQVQTGGSKGFIYLVSSAALAEQNAYLNYSTSTATWLARSDELSTLYNSSNAIHSTLTKYITNETNAISEYNSTVLGISTLSSLYVAAIANQKYARALFTQSTKVEWYIDAMSTLAAADLMYRKSLPSGAHGGGKRGKQRGGSDPILGDTTLWNLRSMADQALQTAKSDKEAAEAITEALKTLAEIAETDLYGATLYALEQTVIDKINLVDKFESYKLSSMRSLDNWSSIYERAQADITIYNDLMNRYSTFYDSSMAGSSTLYGLAKVDEDTITSKQAEADATSHTISSLNIDYDNYTSSYDGYMKLSSFYSDKYKSSIEGLSTLSTLYYSTTTAIDDITSKIGILDGQIATNEGQYYAQSSILNTELINLAIFDTQIKDSVNQQERSAYSYRETYCRLLRLDRQATYEQKVSAAITAAAGAPVNLSDPDTVAAYTSLTSIDSFLQTFASVYAVYDTQADNLIALSTAVGRESESWSTLSDYSDKNFYSALSVPPYQQQAADAFTQYAIKQSAFNTASATYMAQQTTIAGKKSDFATSYTTFFSPTEIAAQNTEISSFVIDGFTQGTAALAALGITFTI